MNSVKGTGISSGHRLKDCDRLSLSSRGSNGECGQLWLRWKRNNASGLHHFHPDDRIMNNSRQIDCIHVDRLLDCNWIGGFATRLTMALLILRHRKDTRLMDQHKQTLTDAVDAPIGIPTTPDVIRDK